MSVLANANGRVNAKQQSDAARNPARVSSHRTLNAAPDAVYEEPDVKAESKSKSTSTPYRPRPNKIISGAAAALAVAATEAARKRIATKQELSRPDSSSSAHKEIHRGQQTPSR